MADNTSILPRDQNFITAAGFESSTTAGLVISGKIDEITGRILVDNAASGTVTSVSVVTANGVSGSVATATTTPAITLALGALTGVTSLNGLVVTANTGVITTGTWNGTPIGIAYGGTNATSFTAPSGTIAPLVFFDGTKLSTDTIVTHVGYDTANDTIYAGAVNMSFAGTSVAKFTNTAAQSTSGGAGMQGLADAGAAMLTGNRLGFYTLGGAKDAAHTTTNATSIESFATENWSGTATGSNLVFSTTANTTLTRSAVLTLGQDKSAAFAGVVTATSYNGLTITTTTGTLTMTNAKTLSVTNTLTLSGTDSTVMTFPTTTATIARTDAGQTFTGTQVMTSPKILTSILDTNGNAYIGQTATASAVNYVNITNAATGTAGPTIAAAGETNVDLKIAAKGTGKINHTSGMYQTLQSDTDGATVTFDMSVSNLHTVTLGGNRTLAVSNVAAGQCFVLRLVQDGTGTRTVTWFTTLKWAGGTAPTLTTTINKTDVFGFICTSAGNYDAFVIGQNL